MVVTTVPFGATKEGGDVIRVTLRIGPLHHWLVATMIQA